MEPHISKSHKSIIGEDLYDQLVCFPSISGENIRKYVTSKLAGTPYKLVPIYVTKFEMEEASKLENKTVQEIKVLIFTLMDNLKNDAQKLQEDVYKKTVKNSNKERHIEFVQELIEYSDEYCEYEDHDEEEDLTNNKKLNNIY